MPELPDFLEPFGGSIHSFHDDEDVDSLEFARPSESLERESDVPEGEGGFELAEIEFQAGSSGGDVGNLA